MRNKKFCQSCGYPMDDVSKQGTNADGSKSEKYCSMCYANGKFQNPEIDTPQKFQEFCMEQMKKDGMSGIMAWLLTRSIPKLERWKK